jgi:aminoglycoside phosphotransferase (APT) family kinase protein
VHSLLRHLEAVGFAGAPRVVDSGFDAAGRETLCYIEGEFTDPGPWTLEGAAGVGQLLRELHRATASYRPPPDAVWQPWFGRALGGPTRVIGHCDVAPWNIVARNGLPVGLIDWEHAGPVDPLVELAQACWLNAKLHDDDVAARDGLPPLQERAQQFRAIVDAYGLSARQRRGFVDRLIEFVVHDTAEQADEARVTPETTEVGIDALGFNPLWALAWRARAAAWLFRHRRALQNALS